MFINPFGYTPYHIVGTINTTNITISLLVKSAVNAVYGVGIPPVNLFVTFIIYDADNNTDNADIHPNIGERPIAPVKLNNSPMKFTLNGVPTLLKLNIINATDNNGIYVINP